MTSRPGEVDFWDGFAPVFEHARPVCRGGSGGASSHAQVVRDPEVVAGPTPWRLKATAVVLTVVHHMVV